ncbi:unnamed protein product [Nippostrongylus brasiliensis]|uniref:Uncharacterized protein n=1 Tax=Nippostrongylus brasiliensis TaxID=27835 RepID=A0A0N4YMJ6_NIPBR|nr:unnamed protein product [Nippostrongylus brasiliensis]
MNQSVDHSVIFIIERNHRMRTNSSSSFASATALDEVAASSSASTAPSDNPEYMKTLRQYGRFFSTRLVQVWPHQRYLYLYYFTFLTES